jgi:nucleotide-binding universal stress UspA family protein
MTPATAPAGRIFLVVVDESEEMRNALRYACRRAQRTNGHVALLHVIERVEFQHWLGVGKVLEEDARSQAELRMQTLASEVFTQTGSMPIIHLREGKLADQLLALLQEDPSISLLVLATARGANPGPLVTFLLGHLGKRVKLPMTLVPGELTEDEIDLLS